MAQKFKTRLNINAEKQEQLTGDTIILSGHTYFVNPINYLGNVSGSLGINSLVTKSYVTGITSTISGGTSMVTGATNGLSLVGKNVVLGGDFTGNIVLNGSPTSLLDINSTIDGNNMSDFLIDPYQIQLTNNTTGETVNTIAVNDHIYFNTRNPLNSKNISILMQLDTMTVDGTSGFTGIEYINNLSNKFKKNSLVTKSYVTGITSTISGGTGSITGATNGVTLLGKNIVLGGVLTGNTLIGGISTGGFFYDADGSILESNSFGLFSGNLSAGYSLFEVRDQGSDDQSVFLEAYSPTYNKDLWMQMTANSFQGFLDVHLKGGIFRIRNSPTGSSAIDRFTIDMSGNTRFQNNGSFTIGSRIGLIGSGSTAIGLNNISSGLYSYAEGQNSIASGDTSHAEGFSTVAGGQFSHAEGWLSVASGSYSHAEGLNSIASGQTSHAEGAGSIASGQTSHAEGNGTNAGGANSHAEGYGSKSSGFISHAEGNFTIASGDYSHAEGQGSVASGTTSHAEGGSTIAGGTNSHAEGTNTKALGNHSHAEGQDTIATNNTSHAEGSSNLASGYASHAEGSLTIASGDYSHSGGGSDASVGQEVLASGYASFNHSYNDTGQTAGYGALADYSTILGGKNHNIESTNIGAVILGGDGIKLTGSTYIDTVAVPSLAIFTTPSAGGSSDVLTWDATNKKITKVTQASLSTGSQAVTGATNGLSLQGKNIVLGGTLSGTTLLSGTTYQYNYGNKNLDFNIGSGFNGIVYAVTKQLDGKILVGGDFTTFTGSTNNRLIRLNPTGSKDSTFNIGTGFNGTFHSVHAVTQQADGKILVGGDFTTFTGTSVSKLIRLNSNGTKDSSFNSGSFNAFSIIYAITQQADGKILVGGDFNTYTGSTNRGLIRLNSNGSKDSTFNIGTGFRYPNGGLQLGTIYSIIEQPDHKILAGGFYTGFTGTSIHRGLIRLNSDGSVDSTFNIGSGFDNGGFVNGSGAIQTLLLQADGKILAGGDYTTFTGSTNNYLIRLNSNGSKDSTFNIGTGFDGGLSSIQSESDNYFFAGGQFSNFDVYARNNLVKLNSNGTINSTFNIGSGFGSYINSLVLISGNTRLVIGGNFTTFTGSTNNYLIGLNNYTKTNVHDLLFNKLIPKYTTDVSSGFTKYSFVDKNYVTGFTSSNVVSKTLFNSYTGTTAPAQFQSHSSIVTYTGTTAPGQFQSHSSIVTYTGTTAPGQFQSHSSIVILTGTTLPATYQSHSSIVTLTGTTLPTTYQSHSSIVTYTGTTAPTTYKTISSFNSYTASTINVTSANNGLTKSGNNVRLGGNLTGATSIGLSSFNLIFTGTTGTIRYGSDLSANYFSRSLVDQGYIYSGTTTPFINDINSTNKFFAYKTNVDLKGQGQIKLTNGSSAVSGISTNFLNATISGTSFWFTFWVKDSANNWYQLALGSVTDNTHATIAFNFNRSDIRNGLLTNRGASFPGVTGTYDYYITRNWSDGYLSVAMGNNAYASDYAMAFGGFSIASATNAIALGYYAYAGGNHSVSLGYGNVVTGTSAIGIGYNHNSKADFGAVLGGSSHIIPKGSSRSAVIGGNAITVSAAVLDTVHMPKLRIGLGTGGSLTTNNSNTRLLGRNNSTGEIEIVNISGSTLVNAANNGLTRAGNNIHLGGVLTGATTIGLVTNNLTFTGTTGTLRYGSNLSAQYNIRSLVDKGYVTGVTSTLVSGATNLGSGNGLFTSVSAQRIQLKSLVAGTNISLTPTSTGITITNTAATGLKYITLQIKSSTVVTTGNKGNVVIPYNGTITRWYLNTDVNATVTVDLWKRNGANPNIGDTITGSAQPALSAANYGTSTTLTGWTTAVSIGDKLELDIVANDLATYIQIIIEIS